MISRSSWTRTLTQLAAVAVMSLASLSAIPSASAQVCDVDVAPEHTELVAAARGGRTWQASNSAQVSALRFRVRPDCNLEILVEFWGAQMIKPREDGSYEATMTRRDARGQTEVLDVVFGFVGAGVPLIEVHSWYFSAAVRVGQGEPVQAHDTLLRR